MTVNDIGLLVCLLVQFGVIILNLRIASFVRKLERDVNLTDREIRRIKLELIKTD